MSVTMKIIPRNIHGVIDYLVGAALMASPWLLGFADQSAQTYVPLLVGGGALFYSLLTNYEAGLFKVIPFRVHMVFDILSGIFLAASPWLFGFADRVYPGSSATELIALYGLLSSPTSLRGSIFTTANPQESAHSINSFRQNVSPIPKQPSQRRENVGTSTPATFDLEISSIRDENSPVKARGSPPRAPRFA